MYCQVNLVIYSSTLCNKCIDNHPINLKIYNKASYLHVTMNSSCAGKGLENKKFLYVGAI